MSTALRLTIAFCLLLVAVPLVAAADPVAQGARVVVPLRDVARGETLSGSDLTYGTLAPGQVLGGMLSNMDDAAGKQTRRILRAGRPIGASDLRMPVLVGKGTTVTMNFTAPGVTLIATGKAMSEGGLGETVTVLNPVSYRQVSAVVTGPGAVTVGNAGALPSPRKLAMRTETTP